MIHGKNLIGSTLSSKGNHSFSGYNVVEDKILPTDFFEATNAEINAAISKADIAFGLYKNTTGKQRAVFLESIAAAIEVLDMELINTASKETGLPVARIAGERGRTTGQLLLFAAWLTSGSWVNAIIDEAMPDRKPLPRADIRQMQIAIGPVAVFGASNFPLAFSVAGGNTVSALAAGCPVVFKAHPAHPATCELVAGAIISAAQKCNMPEGVFSMLHGVSHEVGNRLVTHPLIKAVGFTGSLKGGMALCNAAVNRDEPIPVYAEMSSVNPVVFLPGIIEENAAVLAENFAAAVVLGAGQFCTNPGIFLLLNNEASQHFISLLKEALAAKPAVAMLTSGIKQTYIKSILAQRTTKGAVGLTPFDESMPQPHLLQTTAQVVINNPGLIEEVFGPSTIAIMAENMDELIGCCARLQGQLTATVHGTFKDLASANLLLEIVQSKAGRIIINGFPTGVEVCHAMVHGGPFPATTDVRATSVGTQAIYRFTRPVCYQNFPDNLLPDELKQHNPLAISRMVNGKMT